MAVPSTAPTFRELLERIARLPLHERGPALRRLAACYDGLPAADPRDVRAGRSARAGASAPAQIVVRFVSTRHIVHPGEPGYLAFRGAPPESTSDEAADEAALDHLIASGGES